MQSNQKWIPLSIKLPPLGACIMVTIKNYLEGVKHELRYPVYYLEKVYSEGHTFYHGDTSNILLPEYSEVIAWMPFPIPV